jgi:hypothetical protein
MDTSYSTYVTYHSEFFGLAGATHGQTFLCAQVMVATSVDLNFTRVGSTGDVTLCVCEIRSDGAPDREAVLTKVTVPVGNLVQGWNKFSFPPALLDQGKRYGWFIVTTGNHQLMMTTDFLGGTAFTSTDGIWQQGSLTEDFTFRLNAARFAGSRTVIPFDSLNLDGGMTEVQMVYQGWEPASTSRQWEVKPQGGDEWVPIDGRADNPLANLPPLVQLRLVMLHSEDVAPCIILDNDAVSITGRMRSDMRAISKLVDFEFPTTEAQVVLNMDAFDENHHTVAPKMVLEDGTVVEPEAIAIKPDPRKATRFKYVANFDFADHGGAQAKARIRIDATTDTVVNVPFGQDVQLNAF